MTLKLHLPIPIWKTLKEKTIYYKEVYIGT